MGEREQREQPPLSVLGCESPELFPLLSCSCGIFNAWNFRNVKEQEAKDEA